MANNNNLLLYAILAGAGYYFYKNSQDQKPKLKGRVIVPNAEILSAEEYNAIAPDDTLPAGTDGVVLGQGKIESAVNAAIMAANAFKDIRLQVRAAGKKINFNKGKKKKVDFVKVAKDLSKGINRKKAKAMQKDLQKFNQLRFK